MGLPVLMPPYDAVLATFSTVMDINVESLHTWFQHVVSCCQPSYVSAGVLSLQGHACS